MLEWIGNNLDLVFGILSLIGAVLTSVFGIKFSKTSKEYTALQGLTSVINDLPVLIQTAEQLSQDGQAKKEYVMQQATLLCKALGFTPTEDQTDLISQSVELLVQLSKSINLHTNRQITKLGE